MKTFKRWFLNMGLVGSVCLTIYAMGAFAQNLVKADQGKPGTQGPWPVTGVIKVSAMDGGAVIPVQPVQCSLASQHSVMFMDGGVQPVAPSLLRAYTTVCVSVETTSNAPIIKCRADAVSPTVTVGSLGDTLTTGDCLVYTVQGLGDGGVDPIRCISSSAAYVTAYQCVP